LGADVEDVRLGIGSDSRIGYSFIYPGAGYGGSCFPKDVKALIHTADTYNYPSRILHAVDEVNHVQKRHLLKLIDLHYTSNVITVKAGVQHGKVDLGGKTVAIWGLSFKPNTDDIREATSRVVMEGLWDRGAKVQAYDPEAMTEIQRIYGDRSDLLLCNTKEEALKNSDALVVCTEWKSFDSPDFEEMADSLSDKVVFDGRNIYEPQKMEEFGLAYYGIGRGLSIK